jgi:hypothetical protein
MNRFRFENRREKVATMRHFLVRLSRYALFAGGLLFFSVSFGTIGYHFIGNLNWIDSFHMSCMILTGMGPTSEMRSNSAKIFSSLFALYSGVAFLSVTAIFLAPVVHRFLHILHVETNEENQEH